MTDASRVVLGKALVMGASPLFGATVDSNEAMEAPLNAKTEKAQVRVSVPTRLLAYWQDGWRYEPGIYQLRAGTSAVDLPMTVKVELT